MNILKYKYKLHKLINIIFYLIIFLIGFLMGLGVKKINISNMLSNILFIEKVEAYTLFERTTGNYPITIDEDYLMEKISLIDKDFDIESHSKVICVTNSNSETRWSNSDIAYKPDGTHGSVSDSSGYKMDCYFIQKNTLSQLSSISYDGGFYYHNFNPTITGDIKKLKIMLGTKSGANETFTGYMLYETLTSLSQINTYSTSGPLGINLYTNFDFEYSRIKNVLDFSKFVCNDSVCYNSPEEFFEEQGYTKKCTSDSLFMSFSDYKRRFLRIYSYGDLTEKMSGNDKKGYSRVETFPRFALGKFVFKDGILTRTDDFSTENGENDVIYYDKQYTVDLIKQYQREEISYEQYKLLIDLYDKVFKNYTHLFLEYSLDSDYDKTNQLLYPYLLLGNKENYPDGYEVCFYYNVKTCDEEGKNCVNKNEDLIFTKIQADGIGGYETVEENECIITQEGCVNNFHGSSSDFSYDDKTILSSLQNFGNTINMFNQYITHFFFSLNSTLRSLILCIFGTILIIIIVKLVVK